VSAFDPIRLLSIALLLVGTLAGAAEVDYLSFATEDEANSTEISQAASPAVVFVTNK